MMRFWIAGVALAASVGAAQAQLDLSGAVPPTRPGATVGATPVEPVAPAKAPAEARKPDKPDKNAVDFSVSLASAVGQPLKLNGRDGELTLWGRDRALKIAKLTLAGEVISDPTQKCRIDIVGEQPIEAKSLGRPDGLARYEAEIPVCTFTFDVVEGAVLVPAQNAACVFKAADCQASPGGLWGPDAASLADEAKAIAQARAHADDAAARLLKTLAGAAEGQAGSRRRRTRRGRPRHARPGNLPRLRQGIRPRLLRFAHGAGARGVAEGARRQADPRGQGGRLGGADARRSICARPQDGPGGTQGMLKEFRDFAMRGNVVDLAVAVVIGAAFKQIVDAVVNDVIMPIIGIFGHADFTNFFLPLSSAVTATNLVDARKQGGVLAYGDFITVIINFLIVAAALFLLVKAINSMKKAAPAEPAAPPPPSAEVVLLTEIRDALKK